MLNLAINSKGESTEDLLLTLEEVIRLVEEGYASGQNSNTCSSFSFHINEDAR
jgi:predicted RNase H-like HicB family nuclease